MNDRIPHPAPAPLPEWLRVVQHKVESLRYGVVQLVIHDGRVTQIERTEKTRLSDGRASAPASAD
jgi:hypothetical protein